MQGALAGILGCILGVIGIFAFGFVFVPLATVCAIVGLIRGIHGPSAAGIGTSLLAGALGIFGFFTSPSLWLLTASLLIPSQLPSSPIQPLPRMPRGSLPARAPPANYATTDITDVIVAALERNHILTKAQARCVTFMLGKEVAGWVEIEVRERHGQGCPGDPNTGPRLFNVRYENRSHVVLKERDTMDGYERLR